MSNKPKLTHARQRMEERAEPTKALMAQYSGLQIAGLFLLGLVMLPWLLLRKLLRR